MKGLFHIAEIIYTEMHGEVFKGFSMAAYQRHVDKYACCVLCILHINTL